MHDTLRRYMRGARRFVGGAHALDVTEPTQQKGWRAAYELEEKGTPREQLIEVIAAGLVEVIEDEEPSGNCVHAGFQLRDGYPTCVYCNERVEL